MNTKNLIIAFITVSIAALIVSAFAVFAAARSQYAAILASATDAEDSLTEEATETPETTASPEISTAPEASSAAESITEAPESELLPAETAAPAESREEASSETEEITSAPAGYTLKLDGDRLVLSDPEGNPVCERIICASSLHPKDKESLEKGLLFSDESDAVSAIYDIIS